MSYTDKINQEMTRAMKSGEKDRLQALRSLRAAMLDLAKSGEEVTAERELQAIEKQAKMRRESIEQFRAADRADLAEREEQELVVIQEFLPKQLSEEEIRAVVREIIAETGASGPEGFPKVMPEAKKRTKGRADGRAVQKVVKEELGQADPS